MCHESVIDFGREFLRKEDVEGKRILEVGALNVNGSLRDMASLFNPERYIGIDIVEGLGVDKVLDVSEAVKEYCAKSFDLVICTEVLEHARDYEKVVHELKILSKDKILFTTRSKGFPYHNPPDYHRFEVEDIRELFNDCEINYLEKDPQVPGVFLVARVPKVSIIILNWNTLSYLKKCVESVKQNTNERYELIIVDNGSIEEGTLDYIKSVSNKFIINSENEGFSKANNKGAEIALGEFVCFLNSDVIVGENWLKEMIKTFSKENNCGAVGPLGNPSSSTISGKPYVYQRQVIGSVEEDVKVPILVGFCLLMKKDLFDNIKWCEEFDSGNFEDDYLSEVIKSKNKTLWISANADVKHLHPGRTFESNSLNYSKYLEKNKELFKYKMDQLNG